MWALSSIAGCLVGGLLADWLGRKKALILSTIPFLLSFLLMFLASDRSMVLASRAVAGLGDGLMYPVIPTYLAETASKQLRGSMNNSTNICQNLGMILLYSLCLLLPWRPLAGLLTLPPCLAVLCLLPLPESPYWLARSGAGRI